VSVWSGWQADLLSHAGIPNTTNNRRFLSDWHAHAETNCRNNPIDLSVTVGATRNCAPLPGLNVQAQRYTTTGNAVHAFTVQIHQARYSHLLAALRSGNPYTAASPGLIAADLAAWGSQTFAQRFFNQTVTNAGGAAGYAPTALPAWADLQRQVNHGLPVALRRLSGLNRATKNALAQRSRVRR
jgi:hypothetical protein